MEFRKLWSCYSLRALSRQFCGRFGHHVRQRFLRQHVHARLLRSEALEHRDLLATFTWDGGGTTNNWSDSDNWDQVPVATPGPDDDVVFNSTSTKASILDASFTASIKGLSINSGYTNILSLGNTLTVTANGVSFGAG